MRKTFFSILIGVSAAIGITGCGTGTADSSAEEAPDTLRVATLYGPTSYFIYRDQPMGYDYELVDSLARSKGMVLDLKVATSLTQAIAMLDSGTVQLIAAEVPVTGHYKELVRACGPENVTTQVLVQPKVQGQPLVKDVTDLIGKEVYVESDSKYLRRINHLNDELGGGITVHEVDADSIITEDLIGMVAEGKIPMTLVDSDIARLNSTYFPGLDVSMEVSFPQRSAWAVALDNEKLAREIDDWFHTELAERTNDELLKRYFEQTKYEPSVKFDFGKGYISQYDDLFRKYAPEVGWDWRLLAAQAYTESRFSPNARSWVGARGLMQIMPSTARGYRTSVASLNNPETSLKVATKLINDLDRYLVKYVPNDSERVKFVIAAYNVGIAHVYDAIALAKKYGLDPERWDDNVEKAILMKMNPKFYNDPVVKYGYCRGTETVAYVKGINNFYETARREITS